MAKVFRHCIRPGCGHKSEVDHKTDKGQAEAKNVSRFDSFKQMRRNKTIQSQTGASITYKINGKHPAFEPNPEGTNPTAEYVKAQIEYAAKVVDLKVVVKVIL